MLVAQHTTASSISDDCASLAPVPASPCQAPTVQHFGRLFYPHICACKHVVALRYAWLLVPVCTPLRAPRPHHAVALHAMRKALQEGQRRARALQAVPKEVAQQLAEKLPQVFTVPAKQHRDHGWLSAKNIRHREHVLERVRLHIETSDLLDVATQKNILSCVKCELMPY